MIDRRREQVALQPRGVDHRHALERGKPEAAVERPVSGRLANPVALAALHAVGLAVDPALDRCGDSVGELVELSLGHLKDALVRRHPQVALAVLQDLMHEIVEKSVLRGERGKAVVLEPAEPSASRRNPEDALTVLVDRADGIARESLLGGERREAALRQAREPATARANPEIARPVLVERR